MKPWQLGNGDNTVRTPQLRMEFIYDRINKELLAAGINDPTTFAAFANYLGYSTGGGCTYQDMQVAWTPTNLKLSELIGFFSSLGLTGIQTLTFSGVTNSEQIILNNATDLISLALPDMTDCAVLGLTADSKFTTLSVPLLASTDSITITNNPLITTLTFPSLVTTNSLGDLNDFTIMGNPALTSISLPAYVPDNGLGINFFNNALDVTTVNQVLARCVANPAFVSGLVALSGQTPAAPPSGQGIADKATLIGRGVTVNTD